MKFIQANKKNYRQGLTANVKYLVIHFTANDGDTAEGNCRYYQNSTPIASAHYFCDENGVCQSVSESDTAYHCGAKVYKHPDCRNANSIGIELCSRYSGNLKADKANGTVDFSKFSFNPETIENAANLAKQLMKKYAIPPEQVIRHYDVTGKVCPAPFVKDENAWQDFKLKISGVDNMTVEQAKEIIRTKIGLADKTIEYLWNYRYGDDLLIKIAKAVTF